MNSDNLQIYRVSAESIKASIKRVTTIIVGIYLLYCIALSVVLLLRHTDEQMSFLKPIAVLALIMAICLVLVIRRIRLTLGTYTLQWDNLHVTRIQRGLPDMVLFHGEIMTIEETKRGALILVGHDRKTSIVIPSGIEHKDALKAQLNTIQPIQRFKLNTRRSLHLISNLGANLSFLVTIVMVVPYSHWQIAAIALLLNVIEVFRVFSMKHMTTWVRVFSILRVIMIALMVYRAFPLG
jgi:hypothetical protein